MYWSTFNILFIRLDESESLAHLVFCLAFDEQKKLKGSH